MSEATELAIQARQADHAVQETIQHLHIVRNKAIDALGLLSIINSGNLANATAAIRVAIRDIGTQLDQLHIAETEIEAYRRRLE